jgi:hypothetical protein
MKDIITYRMTNNWNNIYNITSPKLLKKKHWHWHLLLNKL